VPNKGMSGPFSLLNASRESFFLLNAYTQRIREVDQDTTSGNQGSPLCARS